QTIADQLRPFSEQWREGRFQGRFQPWPEADVRAGVQKEIELLRDALPDFATRDAVVATRQSARRIAAAIDRVKAEIKRTSPEMRLRLKLDVPNRLAALDEMKAECDAAVRSAVTEGRKNQVKEWCARRACGLIIRFSKQKPTSGSPESPFRLIASLLY